MGVGEQRQPMGEAPFYIPATDLPARPHRTLKHNDTFAVFDSHGDIGAASGGNDGLFHCDTRYLSHLELLINGAQPLLLGSAIKDDNLSYFVDLTNPDLYCDGRIALHKDTIHVGRAMYLFEGSLRERIVFTNHGADTVRFTASLTFASDFADIFEVRGVRRKRRGSGRSEVRSAGTVVLLYIGIDDKHRQTVVSFEPEPAQLLESSATFLINLTPHANAAIFVTASSLEATPRPTRSFFKGLALLHRERKHRKSDAASVETSNPIVNAVLVRCAEDLLMLTTRTPEGPYPFAGIPWYSTMFGRDGLIAALQMLWLNPALTRGVLRRLARFQAIGTDAFADAEPGKILHEVRAGEMALLREIPFGCYYGSVDSTPLFVMLAGLYAKRTGDYDTVRDLWPAIERALAWIDGPGDCDGDGFVEYQRCAATGLANQGWKDSFDSVFHADGRLAEGPIALVEVQGYVYAARMLAADCARALGYEARGAVLEAQAARLRRDFDAAFWCEDIGTYALALDKDKSPCRVRTSNAGQVLFTGIASDERAERVLHGLFGSSFFSGWGIRTVARGEVRFNPMSYHNGSVWPHDNALIALGAARYPGKERISLLFDALIRAAGYMDHHRLPELFCGFRRRTGRSPTLYPAACSPQAWASGTPFLVLQAMLGLSIEATRREVSLHGPVLSELGGSVTVRNLAVGKARADFALRQHGDEVALEVLRLDGDLSVILA